MDHENFGTVKDELNLKGFNFDERTIEEISQSTAGKSNRKGTNANILDGALSIDLKKCGTPSLPKDIHTAKHFEVVGPVVLQVVSVVDVSQPSIKQRPAANTTLLVRLTDGHTTCAGVEMTPIPQLSVETAPGTKVRLQKVMGRNGKLLLTGKNLEVLGGRVDRLFEKWQTSKDLAHTKRSAQIADGEESPPAFSPFSSKSQMSQSAARKESAATHQGHQAGHLEAKSSRKEKDKVREKKKDPLQKAENKIAPTHRKDQKNQAKNEQPQKTDKNKQRNKQENNQEGLPNPPIKPQIPPKSPPRSIKPVKSKQQSSNGGKDEQEKEPAQRTSPPPPQKGTTKLQVSSLEWHPPSYFQHSAPRPPEPPPSTSKAATDNKMEVAITQFSAMTIDGPMRCLCTVCSVTLEPHAGLGGRLCLTFLLQDKDGAKIRAAIQEDMAGYLLRFDTPIDIGAYVLNPEGAAYIHGMISVLDSQFQGLTAAFDMKFHGHVPIIQNILAYDSFINPTAQSPSYQKPSTEAYHEKKEKDLSPVECYQTGYNPSSSFQKKNRQKNPGPRQSQKTPAKTNIGAKTEPKAAEKKTSNTHKAVDNKPTIKQSQQPSTRQMPISRVGGRGGYHENVSEHKKRRASGLLREQTSVAASDGAQQQPKKGGGNKKPYGGNRGEKARGGRSGQGRGGSMNGRGGGINSNGTGRNSSNNKSSRSNRSRGRGGRN